MFKINGFAHINIVVNDIEEASKFYEELLFAIPIQEFPHFKNVGFANSAGFIDKPNDVDLTLRFLSIPNIPVVLELTEFHHPVNHNNSVSRIKTTNQIGGVGHIALNVDDINEAFEHIKTFNNCKLINNSTNYKPCQLDAISENEFYLFDANSNNNTNIKSELVKAVGNIKFFYFIDIYNIQWEFVSGMDF